MLESPAPSRRKLLCIPLCINFASIKEKTKAKQIIKKTKNKKHLTSLTLWGSCVLRAMAASHRAVVRASFSASAKLSAGRPEVFEPMEPVGLAWPQLPEQVMSASEASINYS
jgi:hypothetical protein